MKCLVAILLIALAANCCVGEISSSGDELQEILKEINDVLREQEKEYIIIPPVSLNFLLASIKTGNGSVGKFSTLSLRGTDQHFVKTVVQGGVLYNFDLQLGLEELKLHYEYQYRVLSVLKRAGALSVSTNTDTLHVKGVLNKKDNGVCTAVLDSVEINSLGKYEVNILPTDLPRDFAKVVMEFVDNKILPLFLPAVNIALRKVVNTVTPTSNFAGLLCKAFEEKF